MNYVIIGASAAGINAAKTLRKLDKSSNITIVSSDDKVYSRCMLHHIISNARTVESISFIEPNFFSKYNINWIKGVTVTNLDSENKTITCSTSDTISYDKLLIATGSTATIPPIENLRDGKNVYVLRNIEDALGIKEKVPFIKKAVIIGGGLVGLDAAYGLIEKGIKVSIVEMADRILPLQLDSEAAKVYEDKILSHGGSIYTNAQVVKANLYNYNIVTSIQLKDGTRIPADIVIVAAGVKSNVDFINNPDLKIERGIVVDEHCKTTLDNIYAAGDVLGKLGVWPLAVRQANIAAHNMAGIEKSIDDEFGQKNSMNFFGIDTVSLGIVNPPDDSYEVDIFRTKNIYKKIIHKDGIIYGAILQGDISYCGVLTQLIKNKTNIKGIKKNIFSLDYADFFNIAEDGSFKY